MPSRSARLSYVESDARRPYCKTLPNSISLRLDKIKSHVIKVTRFNITWLSIINSVITNPRKFYTLHETSQSKQYYHYHIIKIPLMLSIHLRPCLPIELFPREFPSSIQYELHNK
jgi:hypothetical protein